MRVGVICTFHRDEEVPPYTRLAPMYDRVMDHVDYETWADYIASLFKQYGRMVQGVVDGGCGTGSLMLALQKRGFAVAGFDKAFEMIRMARKKTSAPLWQGDLTGMGLREKWDAFLCLYDTIQYLQTEEIELVFTEIMAVLKDRGLFIFDLVPEKHILRYWAHYTERDRWNGWESMRETWYEKRERCQHTEFVVYSHGTKKRYREHHIQRIYRLDEIKSIINDSRFQLIACLDEFTLNPGSEESDRVHFVLRKEAS